MENKSMQIVIVFFSAGLMGCDPQLELEGELKEWVEGAEHGAIFMSFGSVVQASSMPDERLVDTSIA